MINYFIGTITHETIKQLTKIDGINPLTSYSIVNKASGTTENMAGSKLLSLLEKEYDGKSVEIFEIPKQRLRLNSGLVI